MPEYNSVEDFLDEVVSLPLTERQNLIKALVAYELGIKSKDLNESVLKALDKTYDFYLEEDSIPSFMNQILLDYAELDENIRRNILR